MTWTQKRRSRNSREIIDGVLTSISPQQNSLLYPLHSIHSIHSLHRLPPCYTQCAPAEGTTDSIWLCHLAIAVVPAITPTANCFLASLLQNLIRLTCVCVCVQGVRDVPPRPVCPHYGQQTHHRGELQVSEQGPFPSAHILLPGEEGTRALLCSLVTNCSHQYNVLPHFRVQCLHTCVNPPVFPRFSRI